MLTTYHLDSFLILLRIMRQMNENLLFFISNKRINTLAGKDCLRITDEDEILKIDLDGLIVPHGAFGQTRDRDLYISTSIFPFISVLTQNITTKTLCCSRPR